MSGTQLVRRSNGEQALADLATSINAAHEQVERAFHDGVKHAIRAGELLSLAKKQLPHGKWERWLKENVSFRPRTARAYMQIAELDGPKRQRVADLPMREALKAIAQRKYLTPEEIRPPRPLCNEPPISPEENAVDLIHQLRECAQQGNVSDAAIVAEFKRQYEGQDDPQMEDDPNVATHPQPDE
jgi:Protein of unknown function (DUF3102)